MREPLYSDCTMRGCEPPLASLAAIQSRFPLTVALLRHAHMLTQHEALCTIRDHLETRGTSAINLGCCTAVRYAGGVDIAIASATRLAARMAYRVAS